MFNKIKDNLFIIIIAGLGVKALSLGLLYTDALLAVGVLTIIGLREYRADKKRIDYSQEMENRIKSLENKLSVMNMGQNTKQKNPYMPGMPGL